MKDSLFDSKGKRETAMASLVQLKNNEGWKIIEQVLEANIEVVKDLLLHGTENDDLQTIKTLRERLSAYENLLTTPDKLITQLKGSSPTELSVDPFMTIDELVDMRKKKS